MKSGSPLPCGSLATWATGVNCPPGDLKSLDPLKFVGVFGVADAFVAGVDCLGSSLFLTPVSIRKNTFLLRRLFPSCVLSVSSPITLFPVVTGFSRLSDGGAPEEEEEN